MLKFATKLIFFLGSLTNAVGAMYAKKYFPESSKKIADDMVTNIRCVIKHMSLDDKKFLSI